MVQIGYTMLCEQTPPRQLVRDLVRAEVAGFDFSATSDHYFPWIEEQGHSAYAWSVLGAAAQATDRIPLMTMVTCPIMRYHPAVVAQQAATMGVLSEGRFTLGLGAGENLNEHVVGRAWPSVDVRHVMLAEAVDVIRRLFGGGYMAYSGEYFSVDSAKLYDLPEEPVKIAIGASGPRAAALAAEYGDALVAVEPDASLAQAFDEARQARPKYGQLPVCYGPDLGEAQEYARRLWCWGAAGWKVMAELPGPKNFAAYTQFVRTEDVARMVPCGPDLEPYVEGVRAYIDAGYTHVALVQVGADRQADFLDFAEKSLLPALREL